MNEESPRKIALITGASRGIGRVAACTLARNGCHIIAVARTSGALEELDDEIAEYGGSATLVPLDLKDHAGINRLGGAIHERWGKLDILIGNAAILGRITPLSHLDQNEWEDVMAINVSANWLLIRALEPLLLKADAPRALFLTSGAAHILRPYWGAYSVAKTALETLVKIWAQEMGKTKLKANLLNPGAMRTQMRAKAVPGENPQNVPHPDCLADGFIWLTADDMQETGALYDYKNHCFSKREI